MQRTQLDELLLTQDADAVVKKKKKKKGFFFSSSQIKQPLQLLWLEWQAERWDQTPINRRNLLQHNGRGQMAVSLAVLKQ